MKVENIFDEIDNITERIEKEILTNQTILKLVSVKHDDPLSEPDIIGAGKLVDDCIFFKHRVFEKTIKQTQCFLLTDITVSAIRNSMDYADIRVIFRILTHNTLLELKDGKKRIYRIASEICDVFTAEYGTWMGKMSFESAGPIESPNDYQCLQMVFKVTDFKGRIR